MNRFTKGGCIVAQQIVLLHRINAVLKEESDYEQRVKGGCEIQTEEAIVPRALTL